MRAPLLAAIVAGVCATQTAIAQSGAYASGRVLAGIEPGEHLVIVRRLGFSPLSTVLELGVGDSLDAEFLLEPVPQRLGGVNVRGAAGARKLAEFDERRALGIGHFLTQEDIEKTEASRATEVLRGLPGLMLQRVNGRGDVYVASTRGAQSLLRAGGSRPCPAEVMLDGLSIGSPNINEIVQPSDIAAIEWYAGQAQMPSKYGGTKNTCSVLVIWTK